MQVRPDIAALRGVANQASMPYDARLRETTRQATEALGRAEIGDVRSRAGTGTLYGSARELAKRTMGEDYARTVGEAAARAVEESNLQRMQLGMQGAQAAGQLGLSMQEQRARAAQQMGQLEVQGLGLTQQDLASRRDLAERSKQFGAGMGLEMARQSLAESGQLNQYNLQSAEAANRYRLDRLKGLGSISTANTMENIVLKKPGSAGLLPGLISAGGMVAGAAMGNPMAGAAIGNAVGGGLAQGYTGDGSYQGQGMAQMGAMAMGSMQQPGTQTHYLPGGEDYRTTALRQLPGGGYSVQNQLHQQREWFNPMRYMPQSWGGGLYDVTNTGGYQYQPQQQPVGPPLNN